MNAVTIKNACPKCGADATKPRRTRLGRLLVVLTGGLGFVATSQRAVKCASCGAVSRRRG